MLPVSDLLSSDKTEGEKSPQTSTGVRFGSLGNADSTQPGEMRRIPSDTRSASPALSPTPFAPFPISRLLSGDSEFSSPGLLRHQVASRHTTNDEPELSETLRQYQIRGPLASSLPVPSPLDHMVSLSQVSPLLQSFQPHPTPSRVPHNPPFDPFSPSPNLTSHAIPTPSLPPLFPRAQTMDSAMGVRSRSVAHSRRSPHDTDTVMRDRATNARRGSHPHATHTPSPLTHANQAPFRANPTHLVPHLAPPRQRSDMATYWSAVTTSEHSFPPVPQQRPDALESRGLKQCHSSPDLLAALQGRTLSHEGYSDQSQGEQQEVNVAASTPRQTPLIHQISAPSNPASASPSRNPIFSSRAPGYLHSGVRAVSMPTSIAPHLSPQHSPAPTAVLAVPVQSRARRVTSSSVESVEVARPGGKLDRALSLPSSFPLDSATRSPLGRPVAYKPKPKKVLTRKHSCPYDGCSIAFPKPSGLERHILTHTGERPFACEYPGCDKTFTARGNVTAHMRTHTGERPFVCEFPGCRMAFKQTTHLTRHMRVHTGERPHMCDHVGCTKSFKEKRHLLYHLRTHTKGGPRHMDTSSPPASPDRVQINMEVAMGEQISPPKFAAKSTGEEGVKKNSDETQSDLISEGSGQAGSSGRSD